MGIPFTDLSGLFGTSSADDRVIWRRCDSDRLLGEPVEEQPAGLWAAAVESECEFVEVVVDLLVLDAALVRADQPSLEERGDVVDARHDLVSRIATAVDDGDLVL